MIIWIIRYLLMGILFQWLMQWSASKFTPGNILTHIERVVLILIWPVGAISFVFSFIKSFISK
jgi:hypothetical protein